MFAENTPDRSLPVTGRRVRSATRLSVTREERVEDALRLVGLRDVQVLSVKDGKVRFVTGNYADWLIGKVELRKLGYEVEKVSNPEATD